MTRARLTWALAMAIACSAASAWAAEPPIAVVASQDADARRAAEELAKALGTDARAVGDADAAASMVVHVEATRDAYVLRIDARGRAWPARSIPRAGGEAVAREMVVAAARSMLDAIAVARMDAHAAHDANDASADASVEDDHVQDARDAPAPESATPPAIAVDASAADASSPPSSEAQRPFDRTEPPFLRLDAAFAMANVGGAIPLQSGASVDVWWLQGAFQLGAMYTFYPGAVAESAEASLLLTRHTLAALVRIEARFDRVAAGASLGPFAEAWVRSTRAVLASAEASASSTRFTAGAMARADLVYWLLPDIGLSGGAGLELSPASPRFRDASGADVVSANLLRVRVDIGVAARFR